MVLDTSILLAVFFKEKFWDWAIMKMNDHSHELRMSTINLTETLIHLLDRQPHLYQSIENELLSSGIRFIAPDIEQSRTAAQARIRFPLNIGDCFVYSLALNEGCPILTLDKDFRMVDHPVILPN